MTSHDLRSMAFEVASEQAPHGAVGDFIESQTEDDGSQTFTFASRLKGYVGWRWSVNLFEDAVSNGVTVSEILLLPSESALVAPDWVPWSERLADYKALQAELAAQAAADGEEADVDDTDEESDDQDDADDEESVPAHFTEDEVEAEVEAAEELAEEADQGEELAASTDPEPAEDAKGKANNGRGRFQRRRLRNKPAKK